MAAPAQIIEVTLTRTGVPQAWEAFVANRLQIVATFGEDTESDFAGSATVRCELHESRNVTEQAPLAAVSLTGQTTDSATFNFTDAQLNQPLEGLSRKAFWLVIYATYPDDGNTIQVFQLGTLTLLAHPAAALTAPPPAEATFLTAEEIAAAYAPLSAVTVVVNQTLTADATIANPPAAADGAQRKYRIQQDSTGHWTVTLGDKFRLPNSAGPLQWSTDPDLMDRMTVEYRLADDKWDIVFFYPGYPI